MWIARVMQNSDWDHKPKIRAKFKSRVSHTGIRHAYDTLYFYDIWSNIHYGYVGRAAGFSESVLLDGAGLEQIGSDFLRGHWPTRSPGVRGLRAFDDAPDRASISIGVELYAVVPRGVSAAMIVPRVLASTKLRTARVE